MIPQSALTTVHLETAPTDNGVLARPQRCQSFCSASDHLMILSAAQLECTLPATSLRDCTLPRLSSNEELTTVVRFSARAGVCSVTRWDL